MNDPAFGNTMENVTKDRNIELFTTGKRRNQITSEPIYHTPKYFSENLMAMEMKKAKVKMNQSIYFRMPILDISKTPLHVFWYNSVKQRYQDSVRLCYMDTNTFFIYIKHEHVY